MATKTELEEARQRLAELEAEGEEAIEQASEVARESIVESTAEATETAAEAVGEAAEEVQGTVEEEVHNAIEATPGVEDDPEVFERTYQRTVDRLRAEGHLAGEVATGVSGEAIEATEEAAAHAEGAVEEATAAPEEVVDEVTPPIHTSEAEGNAGPAQRDEVRPRSEHPWFRERTLFGKKV